MGLHEFNTLIEKFRKNQCSVDELIRLDAQMQKEETVKEWMLNSLADQSKNQATHPVDYDELFRKIKTRISAKAEKQKAKPFNYYISPVKWAAAIVLAFLIGGLGSYFVFSGKQDLKENTFSEITAPFGSKTEMVLPDGSKVWLNAGSKLKYPNDFNRSNRDISLEGEAFFKVEKNEKLPFVVNALGVDVNVTGTSFNVKAYESENTITTTLVEGKVLLKSKKYHFANEVALLPSQKAIFTKNDKQLLINDIDDIYSEIAWKDNQLIIKGERLSDIAVKLERKYDVKIRFDSEAIKAYKFSGTLKDETIQQVMDVVKFSAPIDYKMNGREITLIMNTATINSYDKFLKKTNE
ncbi:MAG: hypothetical protein A2W90_07955 [Bacteroidetes bacterium GWF2_42_66]|nr:MAG: hypothetical protein A2W92_20580 [Bacteroidetes bacterium GWA2_42_15]OFX99726.1 MAG: hypothetical protein A2W89_03120 [Bacteroidetes bacterium GWE2_42_39]OFY39764.1 MAG: hypothetical protein A2W90_07955 [Bacteroidetes bacterium GWF2_42_66]HBL74816.1 hypothetical protein [Prolixibacteraceae bacterium]HCR90569.1 hypothetical protein [Prolixibacteraceae bacterium]